jgi:zinc-ribbon family
VTWGGIVRRPSNRLQIVDRKASEMLILFGIKRKAYRLVTAFFLCGFCQTPAAQAVTRVRTFFTLFFIPVIPLGSKYSTTCTLCGQSGRIAKEVADQLVAHSQAIVAPESGGGIAPYPSDGRMIPPAGQALPPVVQAPPPGPQG